MKGWPVTVYFESKEAAQAAAHSIGYIVGEYDDIPATIIPILINTWSTPSKALTVGLKEVNIPKRKRTPWDR